MAIICDGCTEKEFDQILREHYAEKAKRYSTIVFKDKDRATADSAVIFDNTAAIEKRALALFAGKVGLTAGDIKPGSASVVDSANVKYSLQVEAGKAKALYEADLAAIVTEKTAAAPALAVVPAAQKDEYTGVIFADGCPLAAGRIRLGNTGVIAERAVKHLGASGLKKEDVSAAPGSMKTMGRDAMTGAFLYKVMVKTEAAEALEVSGNARVKAVGAKAEKFQSPWEDAAYKALNFTDANDTTALLAQMSYSPNNLVHREAFQKFSKLGLKKEDFSPRDDAAMVGVKGRKYIYQALVKAEVVDRLEASGHPDILNPKAPAAKKKRLFGLF